LVYHSKPQGLGSRTILTNSNNSPQGFGGEIIPPLTGNLLAVDFFPIPDATFNHQKIYQIKPDQVPVPQTGLPLVITDSLPAGTFVGTLGFDIRVFDSAGVPLAYDAESVDVNPDGSGDIAVWVDIGTVQEGEIIQMVFGKAGATNGSNPNAIYDSSHKGVYHLNGVGTDSTSNAQNLTVFGTTTVPGKLGSALNFPGTINDYLIRNPFTGFPSTAITVDFWIKTTGVNDGMISYAVIGSIREFLMFDQQSLLVFINDAIAFSFDSFDDGNFHHITVTWRSFDGQLIAYDGDVVMFSTIHQQGASLTDGGSLVLGQDQDTVGGGFQGSQALNGILDEVTISDVVRNQDYITVKHNNQNDNDAFWLKTPRLTPGVPNLLVTSQGNTIEVTT